MLLLLFTGTVIGSIRYDGPEGLLLRTRVAVAQHKGGGRDIEPFAPTPLVAQSGNDALQLIANAQPVATFTPTAPATPTPTATSLAPEEAFAPVENVPDPPTATPTTTPTVTPTPTATPVSDSSNGFVYLSGVRHDWQKWNNCGPTTLAMNLSYFGSTVTQKQVADALKPFWDDKNVSPAQMAAFAQGQGFHALMRVNGSSERLQRLINAGIPVLIETWMNYEGGMGHYRLVVGFDDVNRKWLVYDSFVTEGLISADPYSGILISYDTLLAHWHVFNGTHVVIYDDAHAAQVQEILGDEMNDGVMWERSLERNQAAAAANPSDAFAWFNLGNSLTALGRYEDAVTAFNQARVIGLPYRMLWYQFEPYHAYFETGRYAEVLALADSVMATGGNIEESFYWRGRALQATGDLVGARQAYQRAVELRSNYSDASDALSTLPAS
ncbi:MAG: C39 family peptidase [Caldilineales bacterium]